MAKKTGKGTPSTPKSEQYEVLSPLVNAVLRETKELSKKKPDGPLNELKVKMANRILRQVKELLSDEPTLEFIDLLDDETLPTASDAAFVLSQFRAAMDHFHEKYYYYDEVEYENKWHCD